MHRILGLFIFGTLAALDCAQAQTEPADYRLVTDACQPQSPRFPVGYAKYEGLRSAARDERAHRAVMATKDAQTGLQLEVAVRELDLTGDGVCDDIMVVSDPIGSGGDRDVLATVYLSGKGRWQRLGARSAVKSDRPSELNTIASPADANFAFSDYAVLRRAGETKTYLVAWHEERVTNGFLGYRVFEIDSAAATLRPIDKWTHDGAKVYAAFKATKDSRGAMLFDPAIEVGELRALCGHIGDPSPGLAAECSRLKR